MLGYLLRRVLAAIPVMGVVALFVFLLLRLTPGDPAAILAGGPQAIRLQKKLILDWEELSTSAAVARGIEIFSEAYMTDEPHRMASARLAEMRARRPPGKSGSR